MKKLLGILVLGLLLNGCGEPAEEIMYLKCDLISSDRPELSRKFRIYKFDGERFYFSIDDTYQQYLPFDKKLVKILEDQIIINDAIEVTTVLNRHTLIMTRKGELTKTNEVYHCRKMPKQI